MFEPIHQLRAEVRKRLEAVQNSDELERLRQQYLGARGAVKELMARLKEIPAEHKPEFGRLANELRQEVTQAFQDLKGRLGDGAKAGAGGAKGLPAGIDVTEPALPPRLGRQHVITQTIDELVEVFARMGFAVATGPEIEDEFHNFVALNIPEAHPARDPLDNFYLEEEGARREETGERQEPRDRRQEAAERRQEAEHESKGVTSPAAPGRGSMLRSQTSTIQIRVMETTPPPVRVVAMGRVYRPDEHDATHFSMFHQVEGLYVDRRVSMADLKTTLLQFVHAYFGQEAEVRLRPSFFPFTEPSAEMDVKMFVQGRWQWVELGGCGMVDPAVFKAVGYDPEQWSGFAFGLGIERLAMRKYGIADIRWLFENDVRFLRQF